MNERRSLNSALKMTPKGGLSPEASAFIAGGIPEKRTPNAGSKAEIGNSTPAASGTPRSATEGNSEGLEPELKEPSRSRRGSKTLQLSQPLLDKLLIPVTTRFDSRTAVALRRAHLEQKLKGLVPATLQEIVQIAVQAWLRENDYLE